MVEYRRYAVLCSALLEAPTTARQGLGFFVCYKLRNYFFFSFCFFIASGTSPSWSNPNSHICLY